MKKHGTKSRAFAFLLFVFEYFVVARKGEGHADESHNSRSACKEVEHLDVYWLEYCA